MAAPISRSHFLVVLLLLAFFTVVFGSSSPRKHSIVHQTCKRLEAGGLKSSYAFCVKSLSSDPRSRTANLEGLGLIALQHMSNSFNYSFSYVKKLQKKHQDFRTAVGLQTCAVIYDTSSHDVKQLVKEYKHKNYKRAVILAKAASISPSKCESQFKTQKPLKRLNDKVRKIGFVALFIVRLVAKQH